MLHVISGELKVIFIVFILWNKNGFLELPQRIMYDLQNMVGSVSIAIIFVSTPMDAIAIVAWHCPTNDYDDGGTEMTGNGKLL